MRWAVVAEILLSAALPSLAHEVRPAYLDLREERAGVFRVLWKTPMQGELRLSLSPVFSGRTENLTPVATRHVDNAAVQTWLLEAVEPLRGQSVRIAGLEATMTDALVQAEFVDGTTWTERLTPGRAAALIPARQSSLAVVGLYLTLGLEHILLGVDHLLFVAALLLITQGGWRLFKAVTAFTVAHSITLGLATLGFVHVPSAPVEAVIALSIVFVASEIVRTYRGRTGITARAPWIVAFAFGLLHGFGFAGALSAVGLPQGDIPLALLSFNVGVEVGQLLFIFVALRLIAAMRFILVPMPRQAALVAPYAIGIVAMFWVIQRIALL
jgi:hypothetical protein